MTYNMAPKKVDKTKVHPIWRGVGCFMIVFIPVLSYALAVTFFRSAPASWLQIFPREVSQQFVIPWVNIPLELFDVPITLGVTLMTVVFMFILFAFFSILYSIFYTAFGPSKYGPTDAPPERRKVRKSR